MSLHTLYFRLRTVCIIPNITYTEDMEICPNELPMIQGVGQAVPGILKVHSAFTSRVFA